MENDYISILKELGDEIGETPFYDFKKSADGFWLCTLIFMGKSSNSRRKNKKAAKKQAAKVFYKHKLPQEDLTSLRMDDFPPPPLAGNDKKSQMSYIVRIDSTLSQQQLLEFFGLNKAILDVNFVFRGQEK